MTSLCICGKPIYAKSVCKNCYNRKWRKENTEKVKVYKQNDWDKNKEHYLIKNKEWTKNNQDKIKKYEDKRRAKPSRTEYQKNYRKNNRKKIQETQKLWRLNNPEKAKELQKKLTERYKNAHPKEYREIPRRWDLKNPEKRKEISKKNSAKRNRELGFTPLNSWFIDSEGHHINKEHVIYIPKLLHKMYKHNHNKPETMKEVNWEAFRYLLSEMIR